MARNESPPFGRGQTYYNGVVPTLSDGTTADTTSHADLEGKTWVFEDYKQISGQGNVKGTRTGRYVVCMCVRNVSGGAILPKQLCRMKTTGSGNEFCGQIVNNTPTVGDLCFPADEFLPAAGVVANDLFWVVIGGPATVTTDTAGDTTMGIGKYVIPGATTAGRVIEQDTTVAAGAATFAQIQGAVGIAVTATTGNSQDMLIEVIPRLAWA